MLRNRTIQIGIAKKAPDELISDSPVEKIDISKVIDNTVKTVVLGVMGYVVLDTARQVIVAKVTS